MSRWSFALALALALAAASAGCADRPSSPGGSTATVYALAGGAGEIQATVISYHPDGKVIDAQAADAVGQVQIGVADGALIAVVFPAATGTASTVSVITTVAPPVGGTLRVYGPPDPPEPPTVIGALQIQPAQPITADSYQIQLGCITLDEASLPEMIDVSSRCAGSDANIDVLVTATSGGVLAGYIAGRVSISSGVADLAPAQWDTTTGSVPITLDGVTPALDWVLFSDGLPFAAQPLAGSSAPVWNGLVVDAATVHATIASGSSMQVTTREISGAPSAIALSAADFLPPIAPTLAADPGTPGGLHWTAANPGADALDLRLTWMAGTQRVVWDSILDPAATSSALPATGGDLDQLFAGAGSGATAVLRYIDAPDASSFSDVLASGVHAEDPDQPATVVAPPSDGELRESDATGFAP